MTQSASLGAERRRGKGGIYTKTNSERTHLLLTDKVPWAGGRRLKTGQHQAIDWKEWKHATRRMDHTEIGRGAGRLSTRPAILSGRVELEPAGGRIRTYSIGRDPRRLKSISDEGEGIEQCERTYIVLGSLELLQCRISAISRSIGLLCCQADDTLQADVPRIGFLRRQCQQLIKQGAEMDSRKTTTLQAEAASASRRKGGVSRTRWAWEREKEEKKEPDLGLVLEEDSADMIRSRVHDLEEGAARLHLGHASTTALRDTD